MQMNDMHSIRRTNLDRLFARYKEWVWAQFPGEPERGMMTRFCKACDVSPRYMSHIRNGRKEIGFETARKIEAGLRVLGQKFADVEDNWMDNDHFPMTSEETKEVAYFRALPREVQKSVVDAIQMIQTSNSQST